MALIDEQLRVAQTWSGVDGFQRFRQTGADWLTPDPRLFRAEWTSTSIDGVQLSEWRSTPVSGRPRPNEPGTACLNAIIGGRIRYELDETAYSAEPGSVHLFHAGRSVRLSAPGGMRIARVVLLEEAMPVWLRGPSPLGDGPLPATTLTAGFVALLDRLTAAIREDGVQPPVATAKAIGVLASALLEEAIPSGTSGMGDLREQMIAYIDRHLGETDLGPRRLAAEFDVSLRWVHRVFNQGDESVARYIRERRVDAIAHQLRSERRWVRVADLAARFGFAGRDQLTRAFKQRYGVTVNDYLDLVLQDRPLPDAAR
ncbi:helix-turn-helix domain-containing protein [Amnibacterium endophyticum]|uniref:Helix-turn-helix domain-containing protein n=1 Tax=Amnibacterium endophyticum TaxID=2109337 RepID=A0ABW4LBZ9_9MICO